MIGGVHPSRAVPISPNATEETVALYRRLLVMGRRSNCITGVSEMLAGSTVTYPVPTWYGTRKDFETITGRRPVVVQVEYEDATRVGRYGKAGYDAMRAHVIDAANSGAIISINHHMSNPVTSGTLAGVGNVWPPSTAPGSGSAWDITDNGSAVASILAGGANDALFIAYLDRMAEFLSSLQYGNGRKIPVLLRLFHEVSGTSGFWWTNGSGVTGNYVLAYRRMVSYLRDTKGVTNVLFTPNYLNPTAEWYAGDEYVDVLSVDFYDARVTGASPDNVIYPFAATAGLSSSKPCLITEIGYDYGSQNSPNIWTRTLETVSTQCRRSAGFVFWRAPWGPAITDPIEQRQNLHAMVADCRAVTV